MNVELANALDSLKPTDTNPPFVILDVRANDEIEFMDLPKLTKNKARVPKIHIHLQVLLQGFYPDNLPMNKYIILVCDKGLRAGRAAGHLKSKGYHVKILLGGMETLDRLVELTYRDPGFF